MPGRKFNAGGGYRYSINGQEKEKDLAENITTALYWEYDSRIGRRWNIDPIYLTSESPYLTFGGNPIIYTDPLGDFKTKFGAKWHKFWHGGDKVGQNKYGEWFVSSSKIDAKANLETTVTITTTYGKGRNRYSTAIEEIEREDRIGNDILMHGGSFDETGKLKSSGTSIYTIYNSEKEAGNAALSLGTGVLLPNPILKGATAATNTGNSITKAAPTSEGIIVGTGSVLRKVDFLGGFKHALNKHLVGDGATSLKVLDAGGTLEKWGNYVTLLSQTGSGTSKIVKGGEVLEIMGQMEKTGGGILNVGVRLFKATGKSTWELTTILTRQ